MHCLMHYIKRKRWTAIRFNKVVAILFKILPLKKFRIIYLWSIKRILNTALCKSILWSYLRWSFFRFLMNKGRNMCTRIANTAVPTTWWNCSDVPRDASSLSRTIATEQSTSLPHLSMLLSAILFIARHASYCWRGVLYLRTVTPCPRRNCFTSFWFCSPIAGRYSLAFRRHHHGVGGDSCCGSMIACVLRVDRCVVQDEFHRVKSYS